MANKEDPLLHKGFVGKGKEVARPTRNPSKQVDRSRKGKGKEAERTQDRTDDTEEEMSGMYNQLSPDAWYLTCTRPSGPAEAHPEARDRPCEGRTAS